MFRGKEYFLNKLQEDKVLYEIFIYIGDYSTVYNEKFDFFENKQVKLEELISSIRTDVIKKSNTIIQSYIDRLISYGLCNYVVENNKNPFLEDNSTDNNDVNRLKYYKDLGYPSMNSEIQLTDEILIGYSGLSLFSDIINDKKMKESEKSFEEAFGLAIKELTDPYNEKVEKLSKSLEEKMSEVNRMLDSGIIKNIQVISIFAGIISLLFANVMGIKEFSSIGIIGVLTLNASMVMAIFALILFGNLLIVGEKIKFKAILCCLGVIFFTMLPIILHFFKIITIQ